MVYSYLQKLLTFSGNEDKQFSIVSKKKVSLMSVLKNVSAVGPRKLRNRKTSKEKGLKSPLNNEHETR